MTVLGSPVNQSGDGGFDFCSGRERFSISLDIVYHSTCLTIQLFIVKHATVYSTLILLSFIQITTQNFFVSESYISSRNVDMYIKYPNPSVMLSKREKTN